MAVAAYRIPGQNSITIVKGNVQRHASTALQADGFYINVFSTNEVFYIIPESISTAENFVQSAAEWRKEVYLRPGVSVKENVLSDYQHTLETAIASIETGIYQKLVVSRNHKLFLPDINAAHILDQLAVAFPECLVYIFSTPHTGTWMGATPEKLLVKKSDTTFQTMALAGTMRSKDPIGLKHWQQKEVNEQHMVEEYIENVLQKQGYSYQKSDVFNFHTGLLNHLCTLMDIELPGREHLLKLASALHPTPAVGGLPAREGVHFIKSEEKYLRECYTGYIGPVGIQKQDLLYVNLRCCQWVDDGAVFYAGGGINRGSVVEKEMQEVENKLHNLERFFQ